MKTLYLTVYRIYFEEIRRGVKTTEYRDMSEYWVSRLIDTSKYGGKDLDQIREGLIQGKLKPYFVDWQKVRFKCGNNYLFADIDRIEVYKGHSVFAIKLKNVKEA